MSQVIFFIDGFNVYHSLKSNQKYHKYLWLNLHSLARRFIKPKDSIFKVYYFSAYAAWKKEAMRRHQIYISALKDYNIQVILGKFKEKDTRCKICNIIYKSKEEKQTDVNIASYLFEEALKNNFDTAILLTADTDLIPAIRVIKRNFPGKQVGVLFPIDRFSNELKNVCDFWRKIESKDLSKSQLPESITLANGVVLSRPENWK